MPNSMKLYNHTLAPNPRRVRIFAAEKAIELRLADVDILAGQSRTPEFLAKIRPAGCRCWNSMMVHIFRSRSQFAGIWRGFILNQTC